MNSGKLIVLLLVAVALIGGGWYVYQQQNPPKKTGTDDKGLKVGDVLLSRLETMVDAVANIEYANGDGKLILAKKGESQWELASSGGYPADESKVTKLIYDLLDLKVGSRLTSKSDKYAKFGLDSNPASEGSLRILDSDGKVIVALHRGNEREASADAAMGGGGSGRYIKRHDDPFVYLVDESLYSLNTTMTGWVETEICSIETNIIQAISIDHDSTETFSVDWAMGAPKLDEVTSGMQPKLSEFGGFARCVKWFEID